jgi:hypothetical protein
MARSRRCANIFTSATIDAANLAAIARRCLADWVSDSKAVRFTRPAFVD